MPGQHDIHECEARVTGRVQMVMFRDYTQRKARGLGLSGTVQNLPDGSVRVVAQGPSEQLRTLVARLHEGPVLARVDGVAVEWREPTQEFTNFRIIR